MIQMGRLYKSRAFFDPGSSESFRYYVMFKDENRVIFKAVTGGRYPTQFASEDCNGSWLMVDGGVELHLSAGDFFFGKIISEKKIIFELQGLNELFMGREEFLVEENTSGLRSDIPVWWN